MAKIMIVDDDHGLRQALSVRLIAAGFKVEAAASAHAATKTVLRAKPDLIILDIDMPRFNGLEFHDCLRSTERGVSIPVIYLSGAGTPPNREDAFRQGARAFLTKPYEFHDLLSTVRGVLASEPNQVVRA